MKVFRSRIRNLARLKSLLMKIINLFSKKKSSLCLEVGGKVFPGHCIEDLTLEEDSLFYRVSGESFQIGLQQIQKVKKLRSRKYLIVSGGAKVLDKVFEKEAPVEGENEEVKAEETQPEETEKYEEREGEDASSDQKGDDPPET